MFNIFKTKSEKGQDLAEYALLIGLIALIVILAVTLLGQEISDIFSAIASNISTWAVGS
jgi:pilus assembly protein Flp/PilA